MSIRRHLSSLACMFTLFACAGTVGASISVQYPQLTTSPVNPTSIASGDFNNDGILDIVVGDYTNSAIDVLLGDGKGGFIPLPPIRSISSAGPIVTADFNGDGITDFAVLSIPFEAEVLLGNGDGTFQSPTAYAAGDHKLVVGDFNGDHIPDLATSYFNAGVTTLLIGNGDGTFRAGASVFLLDEIVAADFNLDGKLDLADPHQVAFGNGDGTFQTPIQYGNSVNNVVTTGDFNGDGIPDLAVAYYLAPFFILHLGNGDGTFQKREVQINFYPGSMTSGDFNGDGIADLVILDGSNLDVLLGHLNGAFGTPTSSYVPSIAAITLGDFNRDDKLDVATASPGIFNPINQVYTLSGNGSGGFNTPRVYLTNAGTTILQNIVTADFNKDGIPDVAVSSGFGDGIEVLLGAKGGFKPAILYSALNDPGALAVGDVNNDGNLDLLTAGYYSNQYSLLLGNGDGTFQPPANLQLQFAAYEILLADFNNDGNLDLISSGLLSLGNGEGTFQPYLTVTNDGAGFAAGDLNGDGILDLVFSGQGNLEVFLGNGDGTFTLVQKLSQISQADWLSLADLNGDGKLDLIAPNSKGVTVALGLGNGNFNSPTLYRAISGAYQAQVADFDGDGKPDIAAITGSGKPNQYSVWIFPGNGDGTFQNAITFPVVDPSSVFAIADFNGDGKPDIASLAFSQLLVLKNTSH